MAIEFLNEFFQFDKNLDYSKLKKSDIFSLGMTMLEIMMGSNY